MEKKINKPINIIFLSLIQIDTLVQRGIYQDLLRQFKNNGHNVFVVCPLERNVNKKTNLIIEGNVRILQVKTFNIQKTNLFEKLLATLSISFLFKRAINKYFHKISFDLILFVTPPITLLKLITWLKKSHNAFTYLLLKDIFPQNAVDLKLISKNSIVHKYFTSVERRLYEISDKIGCMSEANQSYITFKYNYLCNKLEVNPNSIEILEYKQKSLKKDDLFDSLNIPISSTVFLYGGNLGLPQGAFFLTEVINKCKTMCPEAFFLIIGTGTEFNKIENWFNENKPINAKLLNYLPKDQFDEIVRFSDVGMILLRKEFTIPNFPSRLLSYLENKLPVLSLVDNVTDIGIISVKENFGKFCTYGDVNIALKKIQEYVSDPKQRAEMGENGYNFMLKNYDVKISYNKIINAFQLRN